MTNPLAPIMDWYKVALDSMRVTRRVVTNQIGDAIRRRHVFHRQPREESLKWIEHAEAELSDLVVLSLVATF